MCKHELEYCPNCDIVHCKLCGKKWGEKEYLPYPMPTIPEPYDWRGPYRWYYSPNTGDSPQWTNVTVTCNSAEFSADRLHDAALSALDRIQWR